MKRSIKSLLENESKFVALLNPTELNAIKGGSNTIGNGSTSWGEEMPYEW
jgi:hypothetical protein